MSMPATFRPDTALRQLAAERCTVALAGFETIWLPVLTDASFARTDLSALRLVFCLGIPERMRDMQARLPDTPLISGYGSTETCSFITLCTPDDPVEARMMTAGRVLPGLEVKVVDVHSGVELPPGQVGELLCRGWSRFEGYHNDPGRTASAVDADGWFHSGDLGRMDEHGRVAWISRLKDMLKVGGENVAALEIEGYLLAHPAVRMAQVVAAPDAHYTEVPAAYVMLAPGSALTEQEIIEHCLGKIATFKVPRYVRFVDEWPMSGTKIQKYILRERIRQELAERGITEAPRLSSTGPTR
jgi:fatty-acyl-CoA synthase